MSLRETTINAQINYVCESIEKEANKGGRSVDYNAFRKNVENKHKLDLTDDMIVQIRTRFPDDKLAFEGSVVSW
jgi:hypothetical protein